MYPVTEGPLTVKDSIHLLWEPIYQEHHIGGVPILNYVIEWDQGGYTWVELIRLPASPVSPNEYLVTGLVNNRTHKFKIRGENKYGLGQHSVISYLRPTGVPEGITPVETNIYGTNVYVEWQAFRTMGRTITAYEIVFQQADGGFAEIPLFCNGRDPIKVGKRFCYIPMLVFRLAPFFLQQDDLIVGKVRAYNMKGWGPYWSTNIDG